GEVTSFNTFADVQELAGLASHIGDIEYRVPLQPLVDCEVVGDGERLAVVTRIEAVLSSAPAELSAGLVGQLAQLRQHDISLTREVVAEHVLRRYKLPPNVVYLGYEAVGAPSAADHRVSVALQIVGKTESGIEIGKTVRLTAKWNTRIDGMPVVSRSILAAVVVRKNAIGIEDRHADVLTVIPVADVLHARTQFEGQPLGCPPIIRDETGCRLIRRVGNGR